MRSRNNTVGTLCKPAPEGVLDKRNYSNSMLMNEHVIKARKTWFEASKKFGFEFVSPFYYQYAGEKNEAFGFIPKYGSKNGTIIELMYSPRFLTDKRIVEWARVNNTNFSFINVDNCLEYRESFFYDLLDDWTCYI